MATPSPETLAFYSSPRDHTDPGEFSSQLDGLSPQVDDLACVLQHTLIHILEAWRYGYQIPVERRTEVEIGDAHGILARAFELDFRPLAMPRPPQRRVVTTCHDYAVLLCAVLRHQGRPARARAGFARYLNQTTRVDHWLCEVWSSERACWHRVDAQLDPVQLSGYGIAFDPNDVPTDDYLTGAEAWQLCRAGDLNADQFGFLRWRGWGYLRHVLLRDAFALAKNEGLPWVTVGIPEADEADITERDRRFLDELAEAAGGRESEPVARICQQIRVAGRSLDVFPWSLADVTGDRGELNQALLRAQQAHAVEGDDQRGAHIGEDCHPQGGPAHQGESKKHPLDRQ